MKSCTSSLLAFIALTFSASSQDKVDDALEKIDIGKEEEAFWTPGFFIGGDYSEGNTETLKINLGASVNHKSDLEEILANAEYTFGEAAIFTTEEFEDGDGNTVTRTTKNSRETNADNARAALQYNRFLRDSDRLYALMKADVEYDDIAQVDYRINVGPGFGYYVVKNDDYSLGFEAGPTWRFEDVGGVKSSDPGMRIGERYERKLSANANLYQTLEYLPIFDDFDDYILDFNIGVEAALNNALNLRVAVNNQYDSTPAAGLDENDFGVVVGLVYKVGEK